MLDSFKARMARQGVGQANAYRTNADMAIDKTFTRDPMYREVFVTHVPSGINNKKVDAKFSIHTRRSVSGDSEDYFLLFRPHIDYPVGSYVDIPNDDGVLQRWLIVEKDERPQFPMYYVLKCNWVLKWKVDNVIYKVLGVLRNQNSYNSGLWMDYIFESVENQQKFWCPTTPYTQTLNYGQRVLMNEPGRQIPLAWKVSKYEPLQPQGIIKLTFTQEVTDLPEDCGKYGIANFCPDTEHINPKSDVCRRCLMEEPKYIDAGLEMPENELIPDRIVYNGTESTIRVGGSPKTFVAEYWDEINLEYVSYNPVWKVSFMHDYNLLCSLDVRFDEDKVMITPSNDCPDTVNIDDLQNVDGHEIRCFTNEKDILKIHIGTTKEGFALNLRCLDFYDMVGKKFVISSVNEYGGYDSEVVMEVIS